jgi:VWFA-related protein
MRKRSFVALLVFSLLLSAKGQQPQPTPKPTTTPSPPQNASPVEDDVVRITTNLVQLDAVVTRDGKHVSNLKAEDFEIFEDGHPQTITNFAYISNVATATNLTTTAVTKTGAPTMPRGANPADVRRTIALVVDDLGISFDSMIQIRKQLRKFVDEQLQPNDLVAVIRTGGDIGALQQFTTDRRLLDSIIERVRWNPCSRIGVTVFEPGPRTCAYRTTGTTLAALHFIVKGMRDLPGRKSMIVFSDSIPVEDLDTSAPKPGTTTVSGEIREGDSGNGIKYATGYGEPLEHVAELAVRSSVVIYAVDTRGLPTTGPTAADQIKFRPGAMPDEIARTILGTHARDLTIGREGSELLASRTGGFLIRNSNFFDLPRIIADQQGYYLIGYRPAGETFNRRFHKISVRVKRRGFEVRTRAGFFGVTDPETHATEQTVRDQTVRALASPFEAVQIPVRLTPLFVNGPTDGSLIRSLLYFDVKELSFTDEPDGWHKALFDLSTVVFGDNGRIVNETNQAETLRLRGSSYDRILRDGLVYSFDTPVKNPGVYQFRVAVRDTASARLGTAGQFIEVPDLRNKQLAISGIVLSGHLNSEGDEIRSGASSIAVANNEKKTPDAGARPGVRRFRQSPNMFFGYTIYNALLDKTTHGPQLTAQVRIFRDGKAIFTGQPTPIDTTDQHDIARINTGGQLQLGAALPPGEYILQVIVNDLLAKDKHRTATQWIDFEVLK